MTPQKFRELAEVYRRFFKLMHIEPRAHPVAQDLPEDRHLASRVALRHCHYMVNEMERFVEEGQLDKASRWLGFIQGVMWREKLFVIENFADHNRP